MMEYSSAELMLLPWQLNPRHIISWWEMEQFSARAFFWIGYALERIVGDCYMASSVLDGDIPIYNLSKRIDDRVVKNVQESLGEIKTHSRAMGLRIAEGTASDLLMQVNDHPELVDYQTVITQLKGLRKILEREMADKTFFYISPERGKFWPRIEEPNPFGDEVAASFWSSYFDAGQAGICLAIGLGTASVFHAMRVLEIGLSSFGAVFGVSLEHTNWQPVLKQIESKIREMRSDPIWRKTPDCKQKQEDYAQIASHFGVLKDAWRNYTMHTRGKYTEDEAELIYLNVKGFMQKLAKRGIKEIPRD